MGFGLGGFFFCNHHKKKQSEPNSLGLDFGGTLVKKSTRNKDSFLSWQKTQYEIQILFFALSHRVSARLFVSEAFQKPWL